MVFDPPLRPARLIGRYKRFLAEVMTAEGQTMTLHCANTGAMTGCGEPGDTLWYSTSHNPKRKYAHSWELTETRQNELICVNTLQANRLVEEALTLNRIPELSHYTDVQREVQYGHSTKSSRIDFLLRADCQPACYLEVKSVTLSQQGTGYFPDTVTTRGQKHLRELSAMAQAGHRAVLFFAILHSGITKVLPAKHIDPIYGQLLEQAIADGVEVFAYQASLSTSGISLCGSLPVSC